jgi:hypothetical protein
MPESPLHSDLVASLMSHIAGNLAVVTHAVGYPSLPDPYKIGRHEPDLIADSNGVLIIGEAKIGEDLGEERCREQIEDFCNEIGPNGEKATFWLCVPDGWTEAARAEINASGQGHYRVDVLTVKGLATN